MGAPNAPAPVSIPQPPSSNYYNAAQDSSGEPGVEEYFQSKTAGAESFAHYIVHWVSAKTCYSCALFYIISRSY